MQVLEWQAKEVLAKAGLRVPRGNVARTPEEAEAAARELGGPAMVKAQVPSGGRGRAGGILKVAQPGEAARAAANLFAQPLLGHPVKAVLVEEAVQAAHELYLAVSIDYRAGVPVLLLSARGGVDVTSAARIEMDPLLGWRDYLGRRAINSAGLPFDATLIQTARTLYDVFVRREATLVEVNPLLRLPDGALVAADARLALDEAASPDLAPEPSGADVTARLKREYDFDYVELDPQGDIGLIGTGAGGTMLTVDLLSRRGGRPINFVDVRTGRIGRDPTRLIAVLDELNAKPNLRVILVSVFGAITDLSVLADTLLEALRARPPGVPVHVRFQGRNQDEAVDKLRPRGIACHPSLEAAIEAVVVG